MLAEEFNFFQIKMIEKEIKCHQMLFCFLSTVQRDEGICAAEQ